MFKTRYFYNRYMSFNIRVRDADISDNEGTDIARRHFQNIMPMRWWQFINDIILHHREDATTAYRISFSPATMESAEAMRRLVALAVSRAHTELAGHYLAAAGAAFRMTIGDIGK